MGTFKSILKTIIKDYNDSLTCTNCGSLMVHTTDWGEDRWECPECGFDVTSDELQNGYLQWMDQFIYDRQNNEELSMPFYDSDKPFACIACGGPYPQCAESCNILDD